MKVFFCKPIAHKCSISSFNSSISSKHVSLAVSDFYARKKKVSWNLSLPLQFSSPHPGKGQIPHRGKASPLDSPLPRTENSQMFGVYLGGKGRGGEVSIWSVRNKRSCNRTEQTYDKTYVFLVNLPLVGLSLRQSIRLTIVYWTGQHK